MIKNTADLPLSEQEKIAQKIFMRSNEPGSSLLSRDITHILTELQNGTTFAKIVNNNAIFTVAFELTTHPEYVEVGMTCNLAPEKIRGKDIFPEIITHYRCCGNNSTHVLYLTTNDIRMALIAIKAQFKCTRHPKNIFPDEVIKFCCTPCPKSKTGVKKIGDQINHCPRFHGEFTPKEATEITAMPCLIFVQHGI